MEDAVTAGTIGNTQGDNKLSTPATKARGIEVNSIIIRSRDFLVHQK